MLLGGAAFLNPFSFVDDSYADSTSTDISVNIGEMIMLPEVSQEAINLALDPDVNGDFESASVNVRMSTNHVSGYTLTMSTEGTETALTSEDFDSYRIDALGSKTSATNFADLTHTDSINKWGYATDNNGTGEGQTEAGYYYGITSSNSPTTIKITDAPTSSSETNVTFATKGKDLAAGTYSNTVVFSAVANAIPVDNTLKAVVSKAGITTMQGLTSELCDSADTWASTNEDFTLKDTRDDSEYKIRKLVDGRCWMTDNLKLQNTTLTSEDSDVISDFTLPASSDGWGWYWPDGWDLYMDNAGSEDSCVNKYGGEWKLYEEYDDYRCYNQNLDPQTAKIHINTTYGVYYNWYTATAGTGTYSVDGDNDALSSICPKNWHLPTGNEDDNGEWHALVTIAYGFTTDFTEAPLSLTLPGVYLDGAEYGQGRYGNWWSSTSGSSHDAWAVSGYSDRVYMDNTYGKEYGRSVRCVLNATGA